MSAVEGSREACDKRMMPPRSIARRVSKYELGTRRLDFGTV
jgi:hypothetical protein